MPSVPGSPARPLRVLLVEDDRRMAASVRRGLAEAGLTVDVIHDGAEGLVGATSRWWDVIVLDVTLPGLDGIEISRELRRQRDRTPILMLTARDSVEDRVKGLEGGADDYLVKPFALTELIARVRALARRHLPDRNSILVAGEIVLDTSAKRLQVKSREVALTAKEFAVLELFLHNPGRLLAQRQIIEHVWNYDFGGGNNLVEVYIGRLRRKLVAAGAEDPFKTVRGFGYRLVAKP
jgi:two-component system, OmpR family, response regulator